MFMTSKNAVRLPIFHKRLFLNRFSIGHIMFPHCMPFSHYPTCRSISQLLEDLRWI